MGCCDQVVPNGAQIPGWMDVGVVQQVAVYSGEFGAYSKRLDIHSHVQA